MIIKNFDYTNELKVIVNECCGPVEYSVLEQNYINLMRLEKLVEEFDKTDVAAEMGKVIVSGKLTESITPFVYFDVDLPRENSNYDYHAARHFKFFLKTNESKDLIQYIHSRPDQR